MNLTISFDVEVKAQASSTFTLAMIDDRLTVLRLQDAEAAREEIAYLERVKAEQFADTVTDMT